MIFLTKSEIAEMERRAALLERIQIEREIFVAENPQILTLQKSAVWAKNHPYLLGAGITAAFVLLPKPRLKKIVKITAIAKTAYKTRAIFKFFTR